MYTCIRNRGTNLTLIYVHRWHSFFIFFLLRKTIRNCHAINFMGTKCVCGSCGPLLVWWPVVCCVCLETCWIQCLLKWIPFISKNSENWKFLRPVSRALHQQKPTVFIYYCSSALIRNSFMFVCVHVVLAPKNQLYQTT